MPRNEVSDVRAIITTAADDTAITACLASANAFLTDLFDATDKISEATIKEIERWLTAHLIASTITQQVSEAKAGSAEVKFQGTTGMRLDATRYGQNAVSLDPTNKLSDVVKGERRPIKVIGVETDYDDYEYSSLY